MTLIPFSKGLCGRCRNKRGGSRTCYVKGCSNYKKPTSDAPKEEKKEKQDNSLGQKEDT